MREHGEGPGRAAGAGAGIAAFCLLFCSCSGPAAPPAPLQPKASAGANVLLITIDTLRRDRLGAYRSPLDLTPVIDKLAADGVRLRHAYSHVPMTLPAHTSILTGRLPIHHGVHTNGVARLSRDVPTLPTILKQAGYRTGAFVGAHGTARSPGHSRSIEGSFEVPA